jgi:hypothetical protein
MTRRVADEAHYGAFESLERSVLVAVESVQLGLVADGLSSRR